VAPLTFYGDDIYISGELWGYWRLAFPHGSIDDMFSVIYDIDDERAKFTQSLAWRGPLP
jgi:hypothetical protein